MTNVLFLSFFSTSMNCSPNKHIPWLTVSHLQYIYFFRLSLSASTGNLFLCKISHIISFLIPLLSYIRAIHLIGFLLRRVHANVLLKKAISDVYISFSTSLSSLIVLFINISVYINSPYADFNHRGKYWNLTFRFCSRR